MKYGVFILWGQYHENGDTPVYYEFDTPEELGAFLRGVEESSGWLDYDILEDATPYFDPSLEPDEDEDE